MKKESLDPNATLITSAFPESQQSLAFPNIFPNRLWNKQIYYNIGYSIYLAGVQNEFTLLCLWFVFLRMYSKYYLKTKRIKKHKKY